MCIWRSCLIVIRRGMGWGRVEGGARGGFEGGAEVRVGFGGAALAALLAGDCIYGWAVLRFLHGRWRG